MILNFFLKIISAYLIGGFVFAAIFVVKGVDKLDESARGSSIGFRIIIIPGTVIFWPLLLKKWLESQKPEHHD
ncbi:MAG: hypothetical protein Q8939_19395 [Bacteroidota bacterium]|nr:hypothetical protein [Bacteroidota bacterium]